MDRCENGMLSWNGRAAYSEDLVEEGRQRGWAPSLDGCQLEEASWSLSTRDCRINIWKTLWIVRSRSASRMWVNSMATDQPVSFSFTRRTRPAQWIRASPESGSSKDTSTSEETSGASSHANLSPPPPTSTRRPSIPFQSLLPLELRLPRLDLLRAPR